jgi:HEAT repeat protein
LHILRPACPRKGLFRESLLTAVFTASKIPPVEWREQLLWLTLLQLRSSKSEAVIRAALRLARLKQKKAVPPLIRALDNDDPQVRMAVAKALGTIRHPASAEPLVSALEALSKSVQSRPSSTPLGSEAAEYETLAQSLAGIGAPAIRPLLGALDSEDKDSRRWAAVALGLIKDPQATNPLIGRLEDTRSEVRKAAALALGEIDDSRALNSLISALGNRDKDTRLGAAAALGTMRARDAVDALARAAADENEQVQITAIDSLGKIGGLKAAAYLRSAMTGPRKAVCTAAEDSLNSMDFSPSNSRERAEFTVMKGDFNAALQEGPAAIPAVIKALELNDPQMRRKAAETLESLASEEATRPLLQALKDHDPEVQEAAMHALIKIGSSALGGLEEALTFYDASVVRLAADAIGEIGNPRAVPALVRLIASNRSVSNEYPEMLEAVRAAVDSLDRMLASYLDDVPQGDLEQITDLPDMVHLQGHQHSSAVDCTRLRDRAQKELLRRGIGPEA